MLNAIVISNAILGLEHMFKSSDRITYHFAEVTPDFDPDLSGADVLVVPNGCDHVAMLKIKDQVRAFLDDGKALVCPDGWFTGWVPGNQWVHNNEKKTKDIRYFIGTDRYGLFDGVELDDLQFNHGISGWWSCGYIQAAPGADVVMHDTWERPIIVLDEASTNGLMFLTASGPLGDFSFGGKENGLSTLYKNIIALIQQKKEQTYATA